MTSLGMSFTWLPWNSSCSLRLASVPCKHSVRRFNTTRLKCQSVVPKKPFGLSSRNLEWYCKLWLANPLLIWHWVPLIFPDGTGGIIFELVQMRRTSERKICDLMLSLRLWSHKCALEVKVQAQNANRIWPWKLLSAQLSVKLKRCEMPHRKFSGERNERLCGHLTAAPHKC